MPPSLRVAFPLLLASACAMRKSALPFNLPDKAGCQRQPKQPKNPKQVLDFPDKEGKRSQARHLFAPPCLLRLPSRSPWQPCFPLAKWTKQLKRDSTRKRPNSKAAPRVTNDRNHDFNNVVVHRPYRDDHIHQSTPHVLTALLLVLTQHTEGNRRRETR